MDQNELQEILDLHKRWLDKEPDGRQADLSGKDLIGARLDGAWLQGANLENAWLNDAWLQKAHLKNAYLDGGSLQEAHLEKACLNGADLRKANLENARLNGANLQWTYLKEAYLDGACLYDADLQNACLAGASLRYADLRKADLRGVNLCKADLHGTLGLEAFIFAGPIGSRRGITQWDMENDILAQARQEQTPQIYAPMPLNTEKIGTIPDNAAPQQIQETQQTQQTQQIQQTAAEIMDQKTPEGNAAKKVYIEANVSRRRNRQSA